MKVGEIAETITVTGQTSLVDVRSANVQRVVTKEVVDAVPTGRLGINLAALQPGIILGAGGGVGVANTNALDVAGRRRHRGRHLHGPVDSRRQAGRAAADHRRPVGRDHDPLRRIAEQLAQLHRHAGDVGEHLRRRRLDGRRRRADQLRAARRRQHLQGAAVLLVARTAPMQGTNYSTGTRDATGACTPADSLFCRGLITQPGALKNVYDFNPGFGGPIVKDKLWFFGTARWTTAENFVPNDYPNRNFMVGTTSPTALNTSTMIYNPDTTQRPRHDAGRRRLLLGTDDSPLSGRWTRRTSSASTTTTRSGSTPTPSTNTSNESLATTYFFPFSDNLVQWSAPQTNRLLLEAGFWRHQETWGNRRADSDIVDPLAVGITDNNPADPGSRLHTVDPRTTTDAWAPRIRRATTRTGAATSTCPTSPARTRSRPASI